MEAVAGDEGAQLLEQQDEGEGEQHLVEVLAPVEVPEQPALEQRAQQSAAEES